MFGKILKFILPSKKQKEDTAPPYKIITIGASEEQKKRVCEGYKVMAAVCFSQKEKGEPRPVRGSNKIFEMIVDGIYAPDSKIKTREIAELWAYDLAQKVISENDPKIGATSPQSTSTPIPSAPIRAKVTQNPSPTNSESATQSLNAQSSQNSSTTDTPLSPAAAALMRAIDEKRKTDPLIGAKLGAKEINLRLFNAMRDEKGIHIETLLTALGSLAGFACLQHLIEESKNKDASRNIQLTVVSCADGKNYYFGDDLNAPLAESEYSVWSLAAGAAKHHGCQNLPDIHEIFKHVSKTVGTAEFGIPRSHTGHHAGDKPVNYVKGLWPILFPIVKQFCPKSSEWPILFGFALQEVIEMCIGVIPLDTALLVIMESAIPMSKINIDQH